MSASFVLAMRQLLREPLRVLIALAGVAFAVILIFMQLGFEKALFDSAVRFHSLLTGEVFLINPQTQYLVDMKPFPRRRLHQALGFRGVESVHAIYAALALWRVPGTGRSRAIYVTGFDPKYSVFDMDAVRERLDVLRLPDRVLYDARSRPEFGPIAERFRSGEHVSTELSKRTIHVVDLFEIGTSFGIDGSVITSDLNFLRILRHRRPGMIEIGLIRLQPGVDPRAVRDSMAATLPKDVEVLTKQQFIEREQHFWRTSTPIGFVFSFGVAMGLVVGTIIVYQILFADVSDHLTEYATLKAMGYRNTFLFSVVLQQAFLLAVLGFVPGMLICLQLYRLAEGATNLPMEMTLQLGATVLGLTVAMCCVSGAITLRKIRSADPAEIF